MASDSLPSEQHGFRLSALPLGAWLAAVVLAFGLSNITVILLRGAKPEWLAAVWLALFFAWGLLCLWSLRAAYLLLLFTLPLFGARPGDLVTNAQDTLVLVTAAVSLWRFPLRLGRRPPLWAGWLLAAVALASLLANASTCFYRLWPFHQDNFTRNLFFMFSQDWDWTIGISEWWMLVIWLVLARGAWHLLRQGQLTIDRAAAAVTAGLILALIAGYLDYFSPSFNAVMGRCQMKIYDGYDPTEPHWPMPQWLRSPIDQTTTMKATFKNRSWWTLYLLGASPVAIAWLAGHGKKVVRWLWAPMLLGCLLAAVLTGSRTSLLAAGTSLLVLALIFALKALPVRRFFAAPALVWLVLVLAALSPAALWFVWRTELSSSWLDPTFRDQGWDQALHLIAAKPLLGVGYESFGLAARELAWKTDHPFITTHSFILQIWVCTGPLGLLALLLLFRTPFALLFRFVSAPLTDRVLDPLLLGWSFVFVVVILSGQAQHWFYNHSAAMLWWLALALVEAGGQDTPAMPDTPANL